MRNVMGSLKDEKVQEGEIVETMWDVKKIAAGLFIIVLLIIVTSYLFSKNGNTNQAAETLGAQTGVSPTPSLPTKEDVQNIITGARNSLSQITSDNLTSSQAAIQKIISDLKELQGKNGAVGVICDLMCKNK